MNNLIFCNLINYLTPNFYFLNESSKDLKVNILDPILIGYSIQEEEKVTIFVFFIFIKFKFYNEEANKII